MNEGGYMRGYADGGLGVDPAVGNPEGSIEANLDFLGQYNVGSTTTKKYYGPNGEEISIDFYNGNPTQVIPQGYTETKPVVKASDVAPTDDNEPEIYKPKKESLDWANMNADELLNQAGKLTTPLARTASGVAQAIIPGSTLMIEAQRKQVANALRNAYNDPKIKEDQKAKIEAQFEANQGGLGKLLGLSGPLVSDPSKYVAPTPKAALNPLVVAAESSAKKGLNAQQFGEYQRLKDQGFTGSGINGYAVGNISDGTTRGVLADKDNKVVKNDKGQTVFVDSKGSQYVSDFRGRKTTPDGAIYGGPGDAKVNTDKPKGSVGEIGKIIKNIFGGKKETESAPPPVKKATPPPVKKATPKKSNAMAKGGLMTKK
jgi:hypothetical protein